MSAATPFPDQAKRFFQREGYVVVRGVFSAEECDALAAPIDRAYATHNYEARSPPHASGRRWS